MVGGAEHKSVLSLTGILERCDNLANTSIELGGAGDKSSHIITGFGSCGNRRRGTYMLACACVDGRLEITLPASGLDPNLPIVAVDFAGTQPYLPQDAMVVHGSEPLTLAATSSLPWHRMQGHDYYSQKKFVVAREWLLWPEVTGKGKLVARRPNGGPVAGFRLSAAGQETQFIFAQSDTAQSHDCLELALAPGTMVTVKLQHITPRCELQDEGLTLEMATETEVVKPGK